MKGGIKVGEESLLISPKISFDREFLMENRERHHGVRWNEPVCGCNQITRECDFCNGFK